MFARIGAQMLAIMVFLLATAGAAHAQEALQEQAVRDWNKWAQHNSAETFAMDYSSYSSFLQALGTSNKGRFELAYKAMKGKGVDILASQIEALERVPITRLNRDEQLAYWLNLYNVGVIHAIASSGVPKSMEAHRGYPGKPGPMWSAQRFTIEGEALSLEDIEVNILNRHFRGKLWMYGLTYGAKGSPPLPLIAFTGSTVDELLAGIATSFVNTKANVNVARSGVTLSAHFAWHRHSLGGTDEAILNHIRGFATGSLQRTLIPGLSISQYDFDWRTNAIKRTIR